MSIKQQDSAIKFAEGVKTLRELFDVSIKEAATFKSLWQSEKDNRAKDKADYKIIIDGYAAIETSNRIEISGLKKDVTYEKVMKWVWKGIAIVAAVFGVYQTFNK